MHLRKHKDAKNRWPIILCAFLATLGLNIDLSLVTSFENFRIEGHSLSQRLENEGTLLGSSEMIASFFTGFSGNSIKWLCIFIALCFLFFHAADIKESRVQKYSKIAAIIFSLFYVLGFSINQYGSLILITGSLISFLKCLLAFIGITLAFYALLVILFARVINNNSPRQDIKTYRLLDTGKKAFWQRLALIFVCWLPYLIAYLPGIVMTDTVYQIAQVVGDHSLSNHHPIFMTAFIGLFIRIGLLLGNINIGVAFYSVIQMLMIAAAFSYVLSFMAERNSSVRLRMFTLLFFMLYPVHAFYSITMWKDSLFSVAFMLLTLKTIHMISEPALFFKLTKNVVIYGLLCVSLFLTRNNGLYIILILVPVLFIFFRKYWPRFLVIIGIFAFSLIVTQIISSALNVQKGSIGEALSIPLQQLARTVKYHGDSISVADEELIASILAYDQLPELYNPINADPVKFYTTFNETAFRAEMGAYLKLWGRLLTEYPLTYLEAFLCHTHGYWYPDFDEVGIRAGRIAPNDYNIHFINIVPAFIENALSGIFVSRLIPAVSMLLSIGFAVWITVILALLIMLKKNHKYLIAFIPALLLWLTCLASPVSGMFRYIYGLFLVLPLLFYIAFQND